MLIFSILLYLMIAIVISIYLFDVISWGKLITVLFLLTVAANTLILQILSLFNQLNSPWLFILFQTILSVGVCFGLAKFNLKTFWQKIAAKDFSPLLPKREGVFFLALTLALLGALFYIGQLGVINNLDSLHTHLPRIYYWLQHNNLGDWNPTVQTQITYPLIPSLQGTYLFLLAGRDNLFFLVHWAALVASLASVYEIAMMLGANNRQASLTVLLTASFPVVMLQTFSLQGDLFLAALLVSAAFFFMAFIKTHQERFLLVSTLPVAISIGSKQTAFLFLPIYLFAILLLFIKKTLNWKKLVILATLLLVNFLAFSSLKYLQKIVFADLEKSDMFASLSIGDSNNSDKMTFQGYSTNLFRYLYQATSLEGMSGNLYLQALNAKNAATARITGGLGLNLEEKAYIPKGEEIHFEYNEPQTLSENSAWFGPLCIFLFPVILVSVLIKKNTLAKKYALFAFGLILIFFLSLVFFKGGWGPNRGRYLIPAVMIYMPLTFSIFPTKKYLQTGLMVIITACTLVLSVNVLLFNDARLLLNQNQLIEFREIYVNDIKVTNLANSLYKKSLYLVSNDLSLTAPQKGTYLGQSYYGRMFYESNSSRVDADFINSSVDSGQRIYTKIEDKIIEFSLFGVGRTREVIPFTDFAEIPSGSYAIISDKYLPVPASYQLKNSNGSISIFYVP